MYALKNMNDWNRMPDALKEQVFKYLDQLAAVANLSEENRIAYDKAVDRYRVSRIVEEDIRREATEEGMKEGMEKGMKEGMKEGLEKGLEEGMKKTQTETARKMKSDGIPFSTIAKYTELSIEEIEQL